MKHLEQCDLKIFPKESRRKATERIQTRCCAYPVAFGGFSVAALNGRDGVPSIISFSSLLKNSNSDVLCAIFESKA
jgi:hypothetical protein